MTNVLEYLEATAARLPEKKAFISEGENGAVLEITFDKIRSTAKSIATLIGSGIIDEDDTRPIAIFSSRSAITPMMFISSVYLNRAYAPLDATQPKTRLKTILDNLDPSCILVDKAVFGDFIKIFGDISVSDYPAVCVIDYDSLCYNIYRNGDLNICYRRGSIDDIVIDDKMLDKIADNAKGSDALYIIHTSGSSGRPKGVVTSHESLINYIDSYGKVMQINENDRFGNQSPLDYIAAIRDIYLPLKYGASSYIIPKRYFMDPNALFTYLNDNNITAIGWSTSALTVPLSLGAFSDVKLKTLSKICFSGSVMPCSSLRVWQDNLPDALFVNQYGPTETTASCTYYVVDHLVDDKETLPIGTAYDGYDVFLTDIDDDTKVITDEDVKGQICISGISLANGYLHDEKRTNESFVTRKLSDGTTKRMYKSGDIGSIHDGRLMFHSRLDRQIKHMGHRVELDEIEYAANSSNGVHESLCVYNKAKESLILYYTGDIDKRDLSIYLRGLIPSFMVPRKINKLDTMPKLANGKIDIKTLEAKAGIQ